MDDKWNGTSGPMVIKCPQNHLGIMKKACAIFNYFEIFLRGLPTQCVTKFVEVYSDF
jgi:hypothetical protein